MTRTRAAAATPDDSGKPNGSILNKVVEETMRQADLIRSLPDAERLAEHFYNSGLYRDVSNPQQALVKILAGRDYGFPPAAAMMLIHVIEGTPTLSANALAALLERKGYTWRYLQHDEFGCIIQLTSPSGTVYDPIAWTEKEATTAELLNTNAAGRINRDNWRKYPRAMYRARCMSETVRAYATAIFAGMPTYVAEEMGAPVDEFGTPAGSLEQELNEKKHTPGQTRVPTSAELAKAALNDLGSMEDIKAAWTRENMEYRKIEHGKELFQYFADKYGGTAGERTAQSARTAILVARYYRDDNMNLWLEASQNG